MVAEDEVKVLLSAVIPSDRAAQDALAFAVLLDEGRGEDTVRNILMRLEEEFELAPDALDAVWAFAGLERGWPS